MNKKAYFISAGCLILGLLLGIGGAMAYLGKVGAEGILLTEAGELAKAGKQADEAYQHDSEPVAVYSLSQYLASLKDAEEVCPTHFDYKQDISFGMLLTHGRLAELYEANGQKDLSTQETAEALKYARDTGVMWVTNQATLAKFVARCGSREVK